MIDDLWWYGDTMWYVYIIDIYRYPSVCVCANAVPICSNLLDDWVWMWWDSWSARLSFFCSFCAGFPISDRLLNSGPVFAVRYLRIPWLMASPLKYQTCLFLKSTPQEIAAVEMIRVGWHRVCRCQAIVVPSQAASSCNWPDTMKKNLVTHIVSPYNSFCNYSHRFGGTEISEMPGPDLLWVILVSYHFYTSISMILDLTIMIWAAQAKLFSISSEIQKAFSCAVNYPSLFYPVVSQRARNISWQCSQPAGAGWTSWNWHFCSNWPKTCCKTLVVLLNSIRQACLNLGKQRRTKALVCKQYLKGLYGNCRNHMSCHK